MNGESTIRIINRIHDSPFMRTIARRIIPTTVTTPRTQRLATIWQLAWKDDRLSCSVYRRGTQLHLQVESPSAVIVSELFDLQPRALARAHALRDALKRRGWEDSQS